MCLVSVGQPSIYQVEKGVSKEDAGRQRRTCSDIRGPRSLSMDLSGWFYELGKSRFEASRLNFKPAGTAIRRLLQRRDTGAFPDYRSTAALYSRGLFIL